VIDHAAPTEAERQRKLELHFVKPLGALTLTPTNIRIEGGERIVGIRVLNAVAGSGPSAGVVDRGGRSGRRLLDCIPCVW
jgi:hypothetical protein